AHTAARGVRRKTPATSATAYWAAALIRCIRRPCRRIARLRRGGLPPGLGRSLLRPRRSDAPVPPTRRSGTHHRRPAPRRRRRPELRATNVVPRPRAGRSLRVGWDAF